MVSKSQVKTNESNAVEQLGAEVVSVTGTEVESLSHSFTASELQAVTSFQDAIDLALARFGALVPSTELGDGFVMIKKEDLIGVPFVMLGWGLGWSDYGDQTDPDNRFSICTVVTEDGGKFRFVDGSTGIHQSLRDRFGDPSNFMPIGALGGLVVNEYTIRNEDGSPATDHKGAPIGKGRTFRIDSNAQVLANR